LVKAPQLGIPAHDHTPSGPHDWFIAAVVTAGVSIAVIVRQLLYS
jgi:hypothetical protein